MSIVATKIRLGPTLNSEVYSINNCGIVVLQFKPATKTKILKTS